MKHDMLKTAYAMQWRKSGIDALLTPANASVASAHDQSRYWGYTSAFNALDLPGAVFPVTTVQDTDILEKNTNILSDRDQEYRNLYNMGPKKYRDAPVCLQLVGKRLQEEKLLATTELVEKLVSEARTIRKNEADVEVTEVKEIIPTTYIAGYGAHEGLSV